MSSSSYRIYLWACVFVGISLSATAQLTVTPGLSAYQLATQLAGPGVTVTNATYTGDPSASGSFNALGTNLGMGSGILLTTGSAVNAIGPNVSPGITTDFGLPGDSMLSVYADTTTLDAAILEFDFVPQNDTLIFRYVFGSDEYPEYVCSPFNDVFGFFLSGPGIVGSPNIALIPGTALPVAINTINSGTPGQYGTNGPNCGLAYPNLYIDNTNSTTIEYDGMTVVMLAKAIVIPCQTYHLKLAIADAGDGAWDSGVFFEKGSLSTVPIVYAGADTTRCAGAVVQLGTTATSGWTYSWTPSTGLNSTTIPNPTATLINNAWIPKTTTYIVTGTNGTCVLKDTVVITINPIPTSPFAVAATGHCAGNPVYVSYSGSASATATYNWSFGGASQVTGTGMGPYNVTYNTSGNYAIGLNVVENGCVSVQTTIPITISPNPTSTFTASPSVCSGTPAQITYTGNASPSAVYTWNFNGGTLLSGAAAGPYSVRWNTPNTYNVTLTVSENGCTSPLSTIPVVVNANPVAAVTAQAQVCTGDTIQVSYTGTTLNASTIWNFGTAQTLAGSGNGPYFIKWSTGNADTVKVITVQNGCRDTATQIVAIHQTPIANFTTPSLLCMGNNAVVTFTGSAPTGTTYGWNFSGGTIVSGTGSGPYAINYTTAGTRAISLILTNSGCRDTLVDSVAVRPTPIAAFTSPVHLCTDDTALVTFTGTVYTNPVYNWNFGNGLVLSGTNAGPYQVQWNIARNDSIHLIVTESGCADTLVRPIAIDLQPIAQFSLPPFACEGKTATVIYNGLSNASTTYSWNFGGGTVQSGTTYGPYAVSWSSPGIKTVHVTAGNNGCTDTLSHTIQIYETPVVDFTATNVCLGLPVQFSNLSTAPGSTINQQSWNFGDAAPFSSLIAPAHTYAADSVYKVTLVAVTPQGCTDSILKQVVVYPKPLVSFASDSACVGAPTAFVNTSTIHTGAIQHWTWSMGNGATATQFSAAYLYPVAGTYPVQLVATSNYGCVDSSSGSVHVWDVPHPIFSGSPLAGCQPLVVPFVNSSTLSDGLIISNAWNFGDGSVDSSRTPAHIYDTPGLFNVGLSLVSEHGCRKDTTYANYIDVYSKPLAKFTFTPELPDMLNPKVFFRNDSWNGDTWHWTFGDNKTATLFEPDHVYRNPGTYEVMLIATSNDGCKDTALREIIVGDTYTIYIPNSFSPNNDGRNDSFYCTGNGLLSIDMDIFSRWGGLVASEHGINVGWDGTYGDGPAQEDTYVYVIKAVDIFYKPHTYTGRVTLIR